VGLSTRQLNKIQQAAAAAFMGDAYVFGVRILRLRNGYAVGVTCAGNPGDVASRLPATFEGLPVMVTQGQPMVLTSKATVHDDYERLQAGEITHEEYFRRRIEAGEPHGSLLSGLPETARSRQAEVDQRRTENERLRAALLRIAQGVGVSSVMKHAAEFAREQAEVALGVRPVKPASKTAGPAPPVDELLAD
jgi:hypothetical protein